MDGIAHGGIFCAARRGGVAARLAVVRGLEPNEPADGNFGPEKEKD